MSTENLKQITVGAGCFWCIEAVYQEVKGIKEVVSGYTGGTVPGKPTYREICSGLTGHAEVVQVTYDANVVSYEDLLVIFMTTHDPTTLNRQGADVGTQYRSVIYFADPAQEAAAIKSKEQNSGRFPNPIVTEITAESKYYIAEDYHQQYLAKRGLENCH